MSTTTRSFPYQDATLPVESRVADLLSRLSPAEKAGLMFHSTAQIGPGGTVVDAPVGMATRGTTHLVTELGINHLNLGNAATPGDIARWTNHLQDVATSTRWGIPITFSTDPLHSFAEVAGATFASEGFSRWPDPLGFAAIGDPDLVRRFADTVRREYLAVGLRAALHPQVDLATEPRWSRQLQTLGCRPETVTDLLLAYLDGLEGENLGPDSVASTTKHFPGAGPQLNGEDAHFPYGREQVYPAGRFEDHLAPFRAAIARGTAAVMPYYALPHGLVLNGEPVEEVGFGFNRQIVTGLLRERLGYDGVVVTDWGLLHDHHAGSKHLPARAWGVEHLDVAGRVEKALHAGVDQFGGEQCPEVVLELLRAGRISEERLDVSVVRLLRVKFQLGLFERRRVDEDLVADLVGRGEDVDAGLVAQSRAVTVLSGHPRTEGAVLPLRPGTRVYAEGVSPEVLARHVHVVSTPQEADLALVRLNAPWEHRDDLFFESSVHQGSLDFPTGTPAHLAELAATLPVVVDVFMDRPALVGPLLPHTAAMTATFGCSDEAWLRAITGRVLPEGRLPVEVPRSMAAVRASAEDAAADTVDPVFPLGHGFGLD